METSTFGAYQDAIFHSDGSSSTVYACPDPASPSSILALKVADRSAQPAPHDSSREIRLLKSLHHEHVVPLLTSFQQHNHLVLVFPFLSFPLDNILREPRVLTPTRRTEIIRGLIQGLAYVHSQGIIHRDIKPSNILLASAHSGPAKIIDFGTAWAAADPSSEPADHKILDVGTTCYRPPELLFGDQKYGPSLDMWAAGCVAAEMLVPAEARGRKKGDERGLFIAGDLGSELQLIKSIFETLGTPTEETWPESKNLPDWGKMSFKDFPALPWKNILPGANDTELDFVKKLVNYESGWRMTAEEALKHPYLSR